MKYLLSALTVIGFAVFYSHPAQACTSDFHCSGFNSKCIKTDGNYRGVCVGDGLGDPPRDRERERRKQLLPTIRLNDKSGKKCSFNVDCGVGKKCLKGGLAIYGTCE